MALRGIPEWECMKYILKYILLKYFEYLIPNLKRNIWPCRESNQDESDALALHSTAWCKEIIYKQVQCVIFKHKN